MDTSTALEAIRERADGQIELDVKRGSATTVSAPHVIVTVPFSVLRGVKIGSELPPAKRKAIDQLGYGTSVKVVSGFDERVWRTKYKSTGSVVCDEWHSVWDASRGQSGKTGILAGVLGGREGATVSGMAAGELSQHLVSHLEPLFHGIADTREAGYDASFDWVGPSGARAATRRIDRASGRRCAARKASASRTCTSPVSTAPWRRRARWKAPWRAAKRRPMKCWATWESRRQRRPQGAKRAYREARRLVSVDAARLTDEAADNKDEHRPPRGAAMREGPPDAPTLRDARQIVQAIHESRRYS